MAMRLFLYLIGFCGVCAIFWLAAKVEELENKIAGLTLAVGEAIRAIKRDQHTQDLALRDHIKGMSGNGN